MTRHVSTENLARFRAGDLSTGRSTRVAAHLRSCARCRETSDALAQVPSLLASVEVPPMPAHLAARIESALAAESAQRTASAPAGSPARSERPERAAEPARARRRHRRPVSLSTPALRVLAVAGAAVILVGGGVALLSNTGGTSSTPATSGAAGASSSGSSAHRSAGMFTTRNGTAVNGSLGRLQYDNGGHVASVTALSSGTNYSRARLTQQVNGQLTAHSPGHPAAGPGNPTAGPAVTPAHLGMTKPQHLSGCVSRIADGRKVLLVDVARFDRKPATIIVTARQGSAPAQVWVVGSGCSASVSDIVAHQPLPRH